MLQTIRLVPTLGEDVEGDLPADGIGQAEIGEFGFQGGDELRPDGVRGVVGFVGVAFGDAGVAADGRDVDHSVSVRDGVFVSQFDASAGRLGCERRFMWGSAYRNSMNVPLFTGMSMPAK